MDKRIVLVKWNDSQDHPNKWVDEADVVEFGNIDCTVESIGYLVSETKKYLTLAADWDPIDKDYGRVTKIAAGMILSVETLSTVPSEPQTEVPSH